tara:strand:- start:2915 stop:4684 length:1770 start_codon:yes stop_codon:yes gene_type:complete
MNKILSFESSYIIFPIRKIYICLLKIIISTRDKYTNQLILYRLDNHNIFLRDNKNISGMPINIDKYEVDTISIKFYQYLKRSRRFENLKINGETFYELYTRQVKLKLASIIKGAYRIKDISNMGKEDMKIITDFQTISIFKEAFLFLGFNSSNIRWKASLSLTACITLNSIIMRFIAIFRMYIVPSKMPKEYFYKYVSESAQSIVMTMPKRRTEDFFSSYVSKFNKSNIILYSLGQLDNAPSEYKRIKIKQAILRVNGIFNIRNIGLTSESYIDDILLIHKDHPDLSVSLDIVNAIFLNKVDSVISKNQTNPLEIFLVNKAKRKSVFVLADVMEEVYFCDAAICSSEIDITESLKLALSNKDKVFLKKRNDLIKYRLKSFKSNQEYYLNKLLNVNIEKNIIFYASSPTKHDEKQRYETEKFLIDYFSSKKDFILVIKTHRQDNGNILNYAYEDANKPINVILVGDILQKYKMVSKNFIFFDNFDFNLAISSSYGFLTTSSTSILQALVLGVKTGVVDKFKNGHHKNLIKHKATVLIESNESLKEFIENKNIILSDEIIDSLGLNNSNTFDIEKKLIECCAEFKNHNAIE